MVSGEFLLSAETDGTATNSCRIIVKILTIQIIITSTHKNYFLIFLPFRISLKNPIIPKFSFNYSIDFTSLQRVGLIQLVLIMCIEWLD